MKKQNSKSREEDLEKEREELKKKIRGLELKEPDYGDDIDHFDEEADEAEDYSADLGKKEAYKARLAEVEEELRKIEHK